MLYNVLFNGSESTKDIQIKQPITMMELLNLVRNPIAFVQHHTKGLGVHIVDIKIMQCDDVDNNSWSTVYHLNLEDHKTDYKSQYEALKLKASRDADIYDRHITRLEHEIIKLETVTHDSLGLRTELIRGLNYLSNVIPNQELAGMLRTEINVMTGIAENTPIQCGHVAYKGMCTSPLGILNGMFPDGQGIGMNIDSDGDMFTPHDVPVLQPTPTPPAPISSDLQAALQPLIVMLPDSPYTLEELRTTGWTNRQLIEAGYADYEIKITPPAPTIPTSLCRESECNKLVNKPNVRCNSHI